MAYSIAVHVSEKVTELIEETQFALQCLCNYGNGPIEQWTLGSVIPRPDFLSFWGELTQPGTCLFWQWAVTSREIHEMHGSHPRQLVHNRIHCHGSDLSPASETARKFNREVIKYSGQPLPAYLTEGRGSCCLKESRQRREFHTSFSWRREPEAYPLLSPYRNKQILSLAAFYPTIQSVRIINFPIPFPDPLFPFGL